MSTNGYKLPALVPSVNPQVTLTYHLMVSAVAIATLHIVSTPLRSQIYRIFVKPVVNEFPVNLFPVWHLALAVLITAFCWQIVSSPANSNITEVIVISRINQVIADSNESKEATFNKLENELKLSKLDSSVLGRIDQIFEECWEMLNSSRSV